MIADRLIDNQIMLSDLLAQAVARGVQLGRGQRPFMGPWTEAQEILAETPDVIQHRDSIMSFRAVATSIAQGLARAADHE